MNVLMKLRDTPLEIIFVRVVTFVLLLPICQFGPLVLWLDKLFHGYIPMTARRAMLVAGCAMIGVVPIATPQMSRADERILNEIEKTQQHVATLQEQILRNTHLIHDNMRQNQLTDQSVKALEKHSEDHESRIRAGEATLGELKTTIYTAVTILVVGIPSLLTLLELLVVPWFRGRNAT